jgi:hypothetical protein
VLFSAGFFSFSICFTSRFPETLQRPATVNIHWMTARKNLICPSLLFPHFATLPA